MFKSITYNLDTFVDGRYISHYMLSDNDFECEVAAEALLIEGNHALVAWNRDSWASTALVEAAAAIPEYAKRGLNVSRNIALLYRWSGRNDKRHRPLEFVKTGLWWLNNYYPQLDYERKYYQCVLNQIQQLTYGRGK